MTLQPRKLSPSVSVAPQLRVEDVAVAAEYGFRAIINNRPDGESGDQPPAAEIEAAAARAGLAYRHIPAVSGSLTEGDVEAVRAALDELEGPVLAFCRSGTRSAMLWALAEADRLPPETILEAGAAAGYDLSPLRPHLEARGRSGRRG